ncbi:Tetratricopeptide repeat-containing protein [Rubritalea squalenifaciens DSM 18772]|uniref:Tetratricopeptide repeat-containing protein n=1 Tax=Rubritalea squalenifaciens DSM 18772 TaxID=1123071 RepID=A0A1M6QND4_9BACT|nr:tetratricopeptide repeat protein [Rubritalea squalenifaciens]SHK21754.1 Tetratricopeptide repeat-containing protein [Rubritalea squalenifaciens DSM 18772]
MKFALGLMGDEVLSAICLVFGIERPDDRLRRMTGLEKKWHLARAAYQQGKLREAARMYRQLLRQQPAHVGLLLESAMLQATLGEVSEAREKLQRLQRGCERDAALGVQVASLYFKMGDYASARSLLEGVWERSGEVAAGSGLLEVLERTGEMELAGRLADTLAGREPRAVMMQAVLAMRAGDPEKAVEILEGFLTGGLAGVELRTVYRARLTLANALERLGRYADAWKEMCGAKELMQPQRAALAGEVRKLQSEQARCRERISQFVLPASDPVENAPHLVTGHPRAGTSVVAVHCGVEMGIGVADEVGAFARVVDELDLEAQQPDGWVPKLAGKVRSRYREQMLAFMPGLSHAERWVDKNPGMEWQLDLWLHAFPGAEVTVVRRDPLDLLVSCLFTYLPMNAWSAAFLDAEGASASVAASMDIQDCLLGRGALGLQVIKYEDFVRSKDAQQPKLRDDIHVNHSPNYASATGKVMTSRVGRGEYYREFLPAAVLKRWSGV